jgi:1,4-alpha-glucan branching enzyme
MESRPGGDNMANKKKAREQGPMTRMVSFEYICPGAQSVALTGDFNQWSPTATLMVRAGDSRWIRSIELPVGDHEYLFVVDGQHWFPDPMAQLVASNPFGGVNSVRQVRAAGEESA